MYKYDYYIIIILLLFFIFLFITCVKVLLINPDFYFLCLEWETSHHVLPAQALSSRYVMGCSTDSRHVASLHRAGGPHL